ncbi:FadR/GntR family transcriptional regulator [Actinospica robiniae]|uniref:FadR/GntR family transcriptional regulator n=1 Tax=Actinospica robiniae TaxID=304901 RepID=UPI000686A376|nr:FCD domain-containing protein [Actinospica robiniae]
MSQHDLSLLARRRGPDPSKRQPPRPDPLLELVEVRRLFEPATAALAAARVTDADLAEFAARLEVMAAVRNDPAAFAAHDVAFHQAVTSVTRNEMLMTLLNAVSAHALLADLPHRVLDHDLADIVLAEHTAIHAALEARDPTLAHAAALLHVNTTEQWLRRHLGNVPPAH